MPIVDNSRGAGRRAIRFDSDVTLTARELEVALKASKPSPIRGSVNKSSVFPMAKGNGFGGDGDWVD